MTSIDLIFSWYQKLYKALTQQEFFYKFIISFLDPNLIIRKLTS